MLQCTNILASKRSSHARLSIATTARLLLDEQLCMGRPGMIAVAARVPKVGDSDCMLHWTMNSLSTEHMLCGSAHAAPATEISKLSSQLQEHDLQDSLKRRLEEVDAYKCEGMAWLEHQLMNEDNSHGD
jgi:hypothetical protein